MIVTVGENADATVLEHHSSDDDANGLTVPVTELALDTAARLDHLTVQALGTTTHQIADTASTLQRDATLRSMAVALGGDYARLRTDTRLRGKGATSELLAVYFGERHQMHDFRTLQAHEAPNTNSELLFKGAAEDQARGVYSGLIRIEKDAAEVQRQPDEPQPRPQRGRARRQHPDPRDRGERGALQPRHRGRSDRRRAALLRREFAVSRRTSPSD